MLSWAEFAHARPDLAEAGRRLLYQFGVGLGFLATVRPDGGPRLHPMCPLVTEDALVGFLQPSPKRQDLHRDGRYALHCFPPDDNEDAFMVSGRALLVKDPGRRQQATAQFLAERQLTTTPPSFEAQRPVRVLPRGLPLDGHQRPWRLEPPSHDLAGGLAPYPCKDRRRQGRIDPATTTQDLEAHGQSPSESLLGPCHGGGQGICQLGPVRSWQELVHRFAVGA